MEMTRQKTNSLPFYSILKILPNSIFSNEDPIPVQIEDWVVGTLSGDDHGRKGSLRRTTIRGVGPRCGQEKGEEPVRRTISERRTPFEGRSQRIQTHVMVEKEGKEPVDNKSRTWRGPTPKDDCTSLSETVRYPWTALSLQVPFFDQCLLFQLPQAMQSPPGQDPSPCNNTLNGVLSLFPNHSVGSFCTLKFNANDSAKNFLHGEMQL